MTATETQPEHDVTPEVTHVRMPDGRRLTIPQLQAYVEDYEALIAHHDPGPPTNVVAAIARIMAEMPGVPKDEVMKEGNINYTYRGIEGITAFHDNVIRHLEKLDYEIERSYTCGDEVAIVVNFQIQSGGSSMDMDLINIYKRSPNGKLQSLRSFWDGSRQRP